MTATITIDGNAEYNYYSNFNSSITTGLAGIGVTSGQIVYDNSTTIVIAKITNGTGTYADNYLRFEKNGTTTYVPSLTMGTGWTSGSDVTGPGAETSIFYGPSSNKKNRYIKSTDGTVGIVQILNSTTNSVEGSYGFVKPTNTTQTAADIPLVMGLGSIKGNAVQTGVTGAGFDANATNYTTSYAYLRYWDTNANSFVSINSPGNLRLLFADVKKGPSSYSALGSTATASGGYQSSSTGYFGNTAYSVAYGCHVNISGNIPIIPNLPVMSGGVPIGYNSNLVLCPPNLNPGDTIVVSAGTEEYVVISTDGIAIRKV